MNPPLLFDLIERSVLIYQLHFHLHVGFEQMCNQPILIELFVPATTSNAGLTCERETLYLYRRQRPVYKGLVRFIRRGRREIVLRVQPV